jgi:hypothetical protein
VAIVGVASTFGPHASKHLVLHLDQIARIEELAVDESRVLNVLRVRIERAAFLGRAACGRIWEGGESL